MNQLQAKKDPWYVIRIPEGKIVDYIYAFLFAVLPIVQPLKTPLSVSWSMLILIISVPFLLFRLFSKGQIVINHVFFVAVYVFYIICAHGTNSKELLTNLFILLLSICLVNNCIETKVFLNLICFFSILGSLLIILQYIFHYILGIHIQFISASFLRSAELRSAYSTITKTGMSNGLYRPSAFFIEPSDLSTYSIPALVYLVLNSDRSKNVKILSIVLSSGIILSTSGMGIALTFGIWFIFFLRKIVYNRKVNISNMIIFLLVLIVIILMFFLISPLRNSVIRIFVGTGTSNNSAITGRLGGEYYIEQLSGDTLIWGTGIASDSFEMYASSIHTQVYTYGIIGYLLFVMIFAYYAVLFKNRYSILALFVIAVSVVANAIYIHYFTFYLVSVLSGFSSYYKKGQ